jgi:hypothetical protein
MAAHVLDVVFTLMIIFIILAGPIVLYRKFISKKTRTVGSRPYVPERDCRACGGWGSLADGSTCTICGGRRTR